MGAEWRLRGWPERADVVFRFNPRSGGLRMSGGCSPAAIMSAAMPSLYDEEERAARKPPLISA